MNFLLDLDDLHPEDGSGLNPSSPPLLYLEKLWEKFPSLKVTLFTTPDWRYLPQKKLTKFFGKFFSYSPFYRKLKKPLYRLDRKRFKDWRKWLREKIKERKVELGAHGLYHTQPQYHYASEFENLNYTECKRRLKEAEKIFNQANIPFTKIFRPPGWLYNGNLPQVLAEMDYKWFAVGDELKQDEFGLLRVPVNCDIKETSLKDARKISEETDNLAFHGHMTDSYRGERIKNGLNEGTYKNLVEILESMDFKFKFLSEV